ncbi:MAG: TrkH family potassium uptake protein [Oscillospiraceae bacterium]|jgi:trk system potassium uptake protein TrkH|nr:TrkH family potassium uptake protein [Oscillospiraceae bacterium]
MNRRLVLNTVGYILLAEAALLLLPVLISLIYRDGNALDFLVTAVITAAAGGACLAIRVKDKSIYAREGFVTVALAWTLMSVFGCLPFIFSGAIPSFIDAFFETVSGFTTTGATIMTEIESASRSILFWRSFTHWIGGMGVLVFVLAVVPLGGQRSMHLMRAEVPGHIKGKLVPKMRDTAKILYAIYTGLTVLEIILLCAGGMSLYDSVLTGFSTAGTGGFSNYAASIAHFQNPYFEYVIGTFCLLFGVNFTFYYLLLIRQGRSIFKNEEFKVYVAIVVFSTLTITANLMSTASSFGEAFRLAYFQTASIITTTGFVSTNFQGWPQYARILLLMLTFIGACTSSTGGGLKVSRAVILYRQLKQGINQLVHPHAVTSVHMDGKPITTPVLRNALIFFTAYIFIAALSILILSVDNGDFSSSFAVIASCFNNNGATTDVLGTVWSYRDFSVLSKLVMCFNMLAGRLEIFPMLILFSPTVWRIGADNR